MSGRPISGPGSESPRSEQLIPGRPAPGQLAFAPPPLPVQETGRQRLWTWVGYVSAAAVVLAGVALLWLLLTEDRAGVDPYLGLISLPH